VIVVKIPKLNAHVRAKRLEMTGPVVQRIQILCRVQARYNTLLYEIYKSESTVQQQVGCSLKCYRSDVVHS